jgi:hypothetical protein
MAIGEVAHPVNHRANNTATTCIVRPDNVTALDGSIVFISFFSSVFRKSLHAWPIAQLLPGFLQRSFSVLIEALTIPARSV